MMRTKLLFVVAVVQLAIAASSPLGEQRRQAGNDNETGLLVITSAPPTCQPFAFPYCNSLGEGYNVTMFPNERGFGFNESRQEFNDFMSLMESGCSAKVRTLFCFFYFPFCVTMSYGGQTISKPVLPCRETCQEVRTNCQALLGNYSWPNWLDCSKDYFLPATSSNWTCANGALSPGGTREPPVPATMEPNAESTAEITTPTSAPCSCKKCKPRVNVSGKTFKNNAYTFAAKVTVVSVGHRNNIRIVTVCVKIAYPLKSVHQGKITVAPTMAGNIDIYINPTCCELCKPLQLVVNATYIVAGYYEDHPSLQWNMPTDNSLASEWSPNASKYNRKMDKWIAEANTYRERQNEGR